MSLGCTADQGIAEFGELADYNVFFFVCNDQIERVESSKSLGLTIDVNLTWKKHIEKN